MQIIPLQPLPAQVLNVQLDGQPTTLGIYQKSTGLYINVQVNNAEIIGLVIGEDRNRIVRNAYLGFVGDLAFIDTQGTADPVYTGLGSRFVLAYIELADLPVGEG